MPCNPPLSKALKHLSHGDGAGGNKLGGCLNIRVEHMLTHGSDVIPGLDEPCGERAPVFWLLIRWRLLSPWRSLRHVAGVALGLAAPECEAVNG